MSFKNINFLFFKFFIFNILILSLTRVILIYSFADNLDELVESFILGFRFDLKLIATLAIILIYLPYLFLQKFYNYKVLDRLLLVITLVILLFSFINFGYYLYFNSEFNAIFFGIANDGTKEVISTIISDFRLVLIFIAYIFIAFSLKILWHKFTIQNYKASYSIKTTLYTILSILILFVFARGSFSTFPLSKKTINSIDNRFLSNIVLNPIWQLYYAYGDLKLNRFTSPKKVLKIAKVKSFETLLDKSGLKNNLFVTTKENDFLKQNPPNVIFVLMEGWSSHIAIFNVKDNNVLGSFTKHKNSDYFFTRFFSNGYGTNPTIEWLLLNSPIKDISQSKAINTKFSTFAIKPFKEAGYKSIFLSGGSSSWRNHNIFWTNQGFDNYIGRASIEKYFNIECDNTWGVYDEFLFKYLQHILETKGNKPIFSFVLTTNNHSPVELPKGFQTPKFNLSYYGFSNDNKEKEKILKGYYYQTNALGKFLDWLKNSSFKDNTIVIATGDHIRKNFKEFKSNSELFYKYAVPFYLYIPKQYDKLQHNIPMDIVGSHNDIFPTLYELSLSQARYYNFGTPLTKKDNKSTGWNEQKTYLFNSGVIDSKHHLFDFEKPYILSNNPKEAKNWQLDIIQKIDYQNYLKAYILNQEFKDNK